MFCGLGNFALPLAQKVREVVAVEGVATMVERAAQNAVGAAAAIQGGRGELERGAVFDMAGECAEGPVAISACEPAARTATWKTPQQRSRADCPTRYG